MGVECVPELKINRAQTEILDQDSRSLDALEVMTAFSQIDQGWDSGPRTQKTYRDLRASRDHLRWHDERPRRPLFRYRSRQHRRGDGNQV